MRWLKKIVRISFWLYIVWLLFTVIHGVSGQLNMIGSEDFSLKYFKRVIYLYIGSWLSYILFFVSAYKCFRACMACKESARNLMLSGLMGILGYAVPMLTFSIYAGRLQLSGLYILIPLYIFIVGVICSRKRAETMLCKPLWSGFIKSRKLH